MSLSADRATIAQALDAVADVTGYDDMPGTLSVGDAWVRWGGFEPTGAMGLYETTWRVDVITGGTPGDAMLFLDTHLVAILDAIDELVYIQGVAPVEFQIPNVGVLYGAEITATKESA